MNIEHFGGVERDVKRDDVEQILGTRFGEGWNEYWVIGEERFPSLSVLVGLRGACLHYFPEPDHPGFLSVSRNASDNALVEFRTSSVDQAVEMPAINVVSIEEACQAVKEFLEASSLPKSVKWSEL